MQLTQAVLQDAYTDTRMYGCEVLNNFGFIQHLLVETLSQGIVGLDIDGFISE
jgi:hypothetical protein